MTNKKKFLQKAVSFLCVMVVCLSGCKKKELNTEPIHAPDKIEVFENLARLSMTEFTGGTSSYDRTGGNADGFGESNFLSEEKDGRKVLLDLKGSGVVWRMWFTGFSQNAEIWIEIDGKEVLQTNLYRLFNGTTDYFPMPLSVNDILSSGGFVSYVPVPYQKGIRILAKPEGTAFFYQFNYSEFPQGTKLVSLEEQEVQELNELWRSKTLKETGKSKETITASGKLNQETSFTLADTSGKKMVETIQIRLGEKELQELSEDLLNQIYLRVYWEESEIPSVDAPLGAFFGAGRFGSYPVQSLFVKLNGNELLCSFPMPFEHRARMELYSQYEGMIAVESEITFVPLSEPASEYGYFCTEYRQHSCKQGDQTSMQVLSSKGRGAFIGVVQSIYSALNQGIADRWHLEGDEFIYVDGRKTPSIQGTGTEDFYNGGWYFSKGLYSNQLSGYTHFTVKDRIDSTAMYRFFIGDKVVFRDGIEVYLEHGAVNDVTEEVETLAFYYQRPEPAIQKTDSLSMSRQEELELHKVQMEQPKETWTGRSCYEGTDSTRFEYTAVSGGKHTFTMQLSKAENGALLRRTFDQRYFHQQAEVLVDGKSAGIWYTAGGNGLKKLCDSDFYINSELTKGKTQIEITIQPVQGQEWNAISYELFSMN